MADSAVLRNDAIAIWRAGVDAVDSERLVRQAVELTPDSLRICGLEILLANLGQIVVVGAGKAGAGMAAGFEQAVGSQILDSRVSGWINVPADCVRGLRRIHLHAARPAGWNEPTEAGVAGARAMLQMVARLRSEDVCVVLLSGGGSALLPAPPPRIRLADKQAVTRHLMRSGATIEELNCVRKQLSEIKGGRLARASRAGLLIALIISDVINDPLDVIASGPTVNDTSTPAAALAVLRRYANPPDDVPQSVFDYLAAAAAQPDPHDPFPSAVHNCVIGNNQVAIEAAALRAKDLGYRVRSLGSNNRGEARNVGAELADLCVSIRDAAQPIVAPACVLSGGEPVVHLAKTDLPRQGGRNQEVALAALERLWNGRPDRIAVLSGGTDGEDGPTDAAGAIADADNLAAARRLGLDPFEYLAINNSYAFFEQTGGLLKTGPTHTNVMDLRVALIGPEAG